LVAQAVAEGLRLAYLWLQLAQGKQQTMAQAVAALL
jgi:hypothetical protein